MTDMQRDAIELLKRSDAVVVGPELIAQALDDLRKELHEIRLILMAQLSIGPLMRLEELKQKEKTAGAGTPTD